MEYRRQDRRYQQQMDTSAGFKKYERYDKFDRTDRATNDRTDRLYTRPDRAYQHPDRTHDRLQRVYDRPDRAFDRNTKALDTVDLARPSFKPTDLSPPYDTHSVERVNPTYTKKRTTLSPENKRNQIDCRLARDPYQKQKKSIQYQPEPRHEPKHKPMLGLSSATSTLLKGMLPLYQPSTPPNPRQQARQPPLQQILSTPAYSNPYQPQPQTPPHQAQPYTAQRQYNQPRFYQPRGKRGEYGS